MSDGVFADMQMVPDGAVFAKELGSSKVIFYRLANYISQKFSPMTAELKHYGQKDGWVLKMYSGSRNLFFVIP